MRKLNCWEYKHCGCEQGGVNVPRCGVCPAFLEGRMDQVHNGNNGGRCCWIIPGTLCGGQMQDNFAKKYKDCERCDFYKKVKQEEYPNFKLSGWLLKKLQD